jgi:hypothetical protein
MSDKNFISSVFNFFERLLIKFTLFRKQCNVITQNYYLLY